MLFNVTRNKDQGYSEPRSYERRSERERERNQFYRPRARAGAHVKTDERERKFDGDGWCLLLSCFSLFFRLDEFFTIFLLTPQVFVQAKRGSWEYWLLIRMSQSKMFIEFVVIFMNYSWLKALLIGLFFHFWDLHDMGRLMQNIFFREI